MTASTKGILAMIGSCIIWGLSSLIYKQLSNVPAIEILAHRTLWSFVFFVILLGVQGRLYEVRGSFSDRRSTCLTVLAALMILANWFLFIWSIETERAIQASLGYYIYPLVSVVLCWLFFGERLGCLQWTAITLVAVAVSALTYGLGGAPWVSLTLAGTFAIYGLLKKQLSVGPVVSVTSEVTLVVPFAVIFLLLTWHNGEATFGQDLVTTGLLIFAGPLTAVPLILFSLAARRVSMATIGLVGYLNPTLQFLCAVVVFAEPFTSWHVMAFAMIWSALSLYSITVWSQEKASRKASVAAAASGTTVI
ncbi:MAG: EamA family transporter RarD [Ascidiaceihabitans sp.]|nr:EamA family transporter RarD [Ascidiaceihabitans sp.]